MTTAKFRPHERLKDAHDFRRVFNRKRSVADGSFIVYGVENQHDYARLGLSVSRKKVREATERNRIKRLVREVFRLNKDQLPTGIDLVVIARGPGSTFAQAQQSLPKLAHAVARKLRRDRHRNQNPKTDKST